MPSGKAARRRRRAAPAPRTVRSKGASGKRRASPRVLIGAGAAVVAIAVAVVLAVAFRGSSSTRDDVPAVGSLAGALPGAADVQTLLEGIPQDGTTLGSPNAPVTMTEYIDLQCPYCQQFETQLLPEIVRSYVRSGTLKVVMRPWAFIGPDSARGQSAVLAAGAQGKAFNVAGVLYDNQGSENTGWLSESMVTSAAASIPGLHVRRLLAELGSSEVRAGAEAVAAAAQADGVDHTPAIFVGKSGVRGQEVNLASPTDKHALVRAIERARRG